MVFVGLIIWNIWKIAQNKKNMFTKLHDFRNLCCTLAERHQIKFDLYSTISQITEQFHGALQSA